MQRSYPLEPGILPAFRLFTGVRLTLLLVNVAVEMAVNRVPGTLPLVYLISLADGIFLLTFLSWGRLERLLKAWYLPVGIILATIAPS